jgi:flagellin
MADGTVVNVASKVSQKPSIEQVASAGEATFPYRTGSSSATFGNLNAGGDGNLNIADAGMQNVTMKGGKAVSGNSEPYYLDPDHTDSSSKVEAELELDAGQWKGTVTATVNKSVASGLADGTTTAAAVTASSIKTAAGLDAKVTFKATTDGSGKVTLDSTDPTIVEDVKDAEGNVIYAAGSKASDAGITVAVNPDDDKKFLISSVIEYEVNKNEVTNKKTGKGVGTIESPIIVSEANAFKHADSNLTYADHIVLQVGARAKDAVDFTFSYRSNGLGDLKADMDASARGLGTDQLKLTDQESANLAIDKIDNAINKVSMIRGTFGAIQNRLEHKISNIDTNTENLTAAESRIRDTQMDKEMMKFTSAQILSQASQSMLAQANSLPQGVLQLLG